MEKFSYISRKSTGERESGIIEGLSQDEVIAQLQKRGLVITSIIPFDIGKKEFSYSRESKFSRKQFSHNGVGANDLVLLARQLAMLLSAGVSLLRSMDVILKQIDSKRLFFVITQVRQDMEGGRTLRDSIAKFPDIFSSLWINLIETGEASGNLPMVLEKLAHYLEETAAFRRKIVSAMLYPVILLFVSVAAILFFVMKIVPVFSKILSSFGVDLPLATRVLIAVSEFLTKRFFLLVGLIAGVVYLYKYLSSKSPFDRMFENFRFKIPVLGDLYRFTLLERFTTTLSILIESGVPILYALEISERSSGSIRMSETIAFIKKNVKEGRSMASPMEKSDIFTPMIVQMVAIGEEVGELANMLKRISKFYQEYLETFVGRLATIMEPLMIVFIGVIIGAMVVSIFLPIFSIAFMKTN